MFLQALTDWQVGGDPDCPVAPGRRGMRRGAAHRGRAGRAGGGAPMTTNKGGTTVGSRAPASTTRALARALTRRAPPELEFVEAPIKAPPLYSYDYDADYPAEGRAL